MNVWPDVTRHGITNLIEVDGLVYAPVKELCSAFGAVTVLSLVFALVCCLWAVHYFRKYLSVINH